MTGSSDKTMLVTGSTSGIGRAVCHRLMDAPVTVVGASRSAVDDAAWHQFQLDITDDASVAAVIDRIEADIGPLDTLVHCAGISVAGAVEDVSVDEARAQFDANYFGALRMIRTVLPVMRARGRGRIIVIGSIGGLIGLPFLSQYSASKFALDGMMQALRSEVRPFGIQATIIHPGDFRTGIANNQTVATAACEATSPYAASCTRLLQLYSDSVAAAPEPTAIANLIARLVNKRTLAPAYIVGSPIEKGGVLLKSSLPARGFEFIFRKIYGL